MMYDGGVRVGWAYDGTLAISVGVHGARREEEMKRRCK